MKNILTGILVFLIPFIFLYFAGAFISAHPNPFDWDSSSRGIYVVGSTILGIMCVSAWLDSKK